MANGPLSRPKLPGIPGINDFKGYTFHTSRWDYRYTGGDSYGNLTGLKDKRVGIIGTGATAIQCIPHLGEWAKQLYVFQRTPSSVDVRNNAETDPKWAASLEPGWQKRRQENFNILVSGGDQDEDLVHDGWTDIFRNLTGTAAKEAARKLGRRLTSEERAELMELADYKKMNQVRARVDAIVKDPATAAALKPWYRQFCKRPCFHDEYLQTYNRPNVDARRHERQRRRSADRTRRRRERPRIRSRLPDLRDRLRGRHVVHATRRLRHRRPRRQDAVGTLVRTDCARCTDSRRTASRTVSSSASRRPRSRSACRRR